MKRSITPGVNPRLIDGHFSEVERQIIGRLGREWYVTSGGGQVILGKTSTYRYFLIKPTDIYQEMFNLEREIVALFSPYDSFEPRTLDAIDYATKKYQLLRIDRICSVLISKDKLIEMKLDDLLKGDPESQIVVPFTYDELLGKFDSYFMRNRFKSHFYTRDLFAFEAPLRTDLYFFGRGDLVHKLVNRHRSNESSGLFGLRKTGKTSVIFGVQRALSHIDGKSVFIDCQNTAFHRRRWNSALHYVISELKRQNQLEITTEPQDSYTEENASILFEKELCEIYDRLGKKNILIVFDEIENITFGVSPSRHWAEELDFVFFWQTLRYVFQKLNNVFAYLIVGTNPMCIETPSIHGKDNPILNQVPFEYIPKFDVPQTREMVRKIGRIMGLKFDEIIYGKLTEDYGGHPFLMRHVCSVINRISPTERPTFIDKTVYEKAKSIFNKEYSRYIEMVLNVLHQFYNDEYAMLEYLARGDTKTFHEFSEMSPYYTSHLLGYGIVEGCLDSYSFGIESVRHYLASIDKYRKLDLTPKEMLGEISERRNILEPKLRYIIRSQLVASYGKVLAREKVLHAFGGSRKSQYSASPYESLFDPNESKIYFNDLRKLVVRNWDCFKNIFGPDSHEFDRRMRAINKFRIDAHAKNLNAEEMAYFRICITAIEKQVEEFLS